MPFVILIVYLVLSYIYPGEIFPELAPYRITYWVGLAGLAFSTLWLLFRRTALFLPQLWILAAFALTLGISQALAESWLGAPVYAVQRFAPSLTMFLLVVAGIDSLRKLRIIVICFILLSTAVMVQGIAAYHFNYMPRLFLFDPTSHGEESTNFDPTTGELDVQRGDSDEEDVEGPVRIRGLGLLHDPNDLAMGFVVAMGLLMAAWRRGAFARNTLLVVLPGIALSYGVYLTHSRGGTLAMVVAIWRGARAKFGKTTSVVMFVLMAGAALGLNFAGGRGTSLDESASGRLEAWTEGFEMLKSRPILGVGYGQFLEHHTLTAHNSFVLCFAETGLVGYFLWLALIVIAFIQLRGLIRGKGTDPLDEQLRQWASTLQVALIGFLTAAFFLSRTFVPMLYMLIGLCAALSVIARRADKPVALPSLPRLTTLIAVTEFASILIVYAVIKLHLA